MIDCRLAFGEQLAMRGQPMRLDRKDKIARRLNGPAPKTLRRLRAIKGGVDLDGAQFSAGETKLLCLRQTARIEIVPPRREAPAADADPDASGLHCVEAQRNASVERTPRLLRTACRPPHFTMSARLSGFASCGSIASRRRLVGRIANRVKGQLPRSATAPNAQRQSRSS